MEIFNPEQIFSNVGIVGCVFFKNIEFKEE